MNIEHIAHVVLHIVSNLICIRFLADPLHILFSADSPGGGEAAKTDILLRHESSTDKQS